MSPRIVLLGGFSASCASALRRALPPDDGWDVRAVPDAAGVARALASGPPPVFVVLDAVALGLANLPALCRSVRRAVPSPSAVRLEVLLPELSPAAVRAAYAAGADECRRGPVSAGTLALFVLAKAPSPPAAAADAFRFDSAAGVARLGGRPLDLTASERNLRLPIFAHHRRIRSGPAASAGCRNLRPPIFKFLFGQLEHEADGKTPDVAFDLLVQSPGRHTVQFRQITVEQNLNSADGEYARLDEVIVDDGGGEGCRRRHRNELAVGLFHCDCPFFSGGRGGVSRGCSRGTGNRLPQRPGKNVAWQATFFGRAKDPPAAEWQPEICCTNVAIGFRGIVVESFPAMTNKRNGDAGASARTVLVVEADGALAKKLRAELERRGFAVSIRRNGSAESAASGRESPSSSSEDGGAANQTLSEEEIGILLWNLTPLETKALSLLLRNAGTTIPRRTLYRRLYGGPGPRESRAVDQLLLRLKGKLGSLGRNIETHRGIGVLWNPDRKSTSGFSPQRLLRMLASCRSAVLSLLLVVGFAAGWLLRAGTTARPAPGAEELIPPPPPPVEAFAATEGMAVASGHGPECAIDGNTNTWFQTLGPARKRDLVQVLYRPNVRGRLSVRCGVPGSTNALPQVRVGVQYADDEQRRLGFVDPATGAFSRDLEKPVYKVFVAVANDSDEPFAIRSVTVEP